ncbi:MAG: sensor histidine kinase [Anaerolineales bacterium]|nr:sensor histidine kinase [Anaerolineales bacterium]
MRSVNLSTSVDWVILVIRWAFLIGLSVWMIKGVGFTLPLSILLGVATCMNFFATMLVGVSRRKRSFRTANLLGDFLFAHLFFYLSAPYQLDTYWVSLLPLITASLYYQWAGAIVCIVLNIITQGLVANLFLPTEEVFRLLGVLLPLCLVVGLFFAFLSQALGKGLFQRSTGSAPPEIDEKERERRRAIYNLISALSSSLNYTRVMETALDLSAKTLVELNAPAEKLISAVMLYAPNANKEPELRIGTSRGLVLSDTRITMPGTTGLIARAIDEGQPTLSRNLHRDQELNRFLSLRDCRSVYCIPLRSGLDAYGILIFAHPEIEFFTPDRREILDIIGNQAMIALQNAQLYRDLELEKERMMEIQEEARKKIARDLHDGPTQSVAAIAMRVNFARRLIERDAKSASEELFKIEELARRTTKEIRHMLFTLRPLVLESQGLVAALESMAEKTKETYNQEVIVQVDPEIVQTLEASKQAVVFYIAEEAVNNARKHARAAHIWVRLKSLRENLNMLEIEDDGVGFNVGEVDASYNNRGSLGMVNMRERAELVNGVLRIESSPGRGTRVRVVIPLSEEAADRLRHGL